MRSCFQTCFQSQNSFPESNTQQLAFTENRRQGSQETHACCKDESSFEDRVCKILKGNFTRAFVCSCASLKMPFSLLFFPFERWGLWTTRKTSRPLLVLLLTDFAEISFPKAANKFPFFFLLKQKTSQCGDQEMLGKPCWRSMSRNFVSIR